MTDLAAASNKQNNPQSQEKNSLAHGHIIPAAAIDYNYLTGIKTSPVFIKHGNLYKFATCPGYRRYSISPIIGFWLGGLGGLLHIESGYGRMRRPDGTVTAGPKW